MSLLSQARRSQAGAKVEFGALRAYALAHEQLWRNRKDPDALVFGHQKTGTSVVAAVIAQQAKVSHAIDLPVERLRPADPAYVGVTELLRRSAPFVNQQLIKEPHWTLFAPKLLSELPDVRAVGVIRNPIKTIESICYRLKLPTALLDRPATVGPWWQPIFDGHGLDCQKGSALENLACRIALCEEKLCETTYSFPDRMRIIQYEDFVLSPAASARELLKFFGWQLCGEADTDRQYQPGLRAASESEKAQYRLSKKQCSVVWGIVNPDSTHRQTLGRSPNESR